MVEEMRFHLERRAEAYMAEGTPPPEAQLAAQRKFGNLGSIQEQARAARRNGTWDRLAKDVRFALRQLGRAPGFTLLAVTALSLGIGANTAMFSLLNGLLLRPLPYPDLAQLDHIHRLDPQLGATPLAAAEFAQLRAAASPYGEFAAYQLARVGLAEGDQAAELILTANATPNLFRVLGVAPQLGRSFAPDFETARDAAPALISDRLWRRRFGGRPDVLGRVVRLDGEPHVIFGVLPPTFNEWRHLGGVEAFRVLPVATIATTTPLAVVGRRAPGRDFAEGAALIATTGSQAAERAAPETRWQSVPLQTTVAGPDFRLMLPLLIGLSGCVLLLACSNLANLQLVRAIGRSREFAVRGALGASRLQLIRPLVVEALVLAVAGAAGALLVAHGVHLAIAAATTNEYGESFPLAIDARVLAWSALAATAAAVTFAIAPVLFAWRLDLHATLKSGGRTGSGRQPRVQQVLIVGQFAAALALLVAAAFFARGLSRAHGDASGWEARAVTLGTIVLPASATPPRADFPRALLQELARLPGAAHVSLSSASPYFPWSEKRTLVAAGPNATDRTPSVSINRVSAGYFSTYGTPLRRGRTFDERDQPDGARVAIVSESLARVLAPDADVLGRRLAWSAEQAPQEVEIVGIVADVLPADPSAPRLALQAYVPLAQEPSARLVIGVRAAAGVAPDSAVGAIRQLVYRLSPDLPVRGLQTAETAIARGLGDMRVFRDLLASFGVLGLALAALGISGMVARNLAQRRPEFAVRAALGAAPPDLLRLALGRSLGQASLGTALGAIAGFFITRLLSAAFPGLPGDGILIVVATSAALLLFALLASWWPARRAARVDPALALRGD